MLYRKEPNSILLQVTRGWGRSLSRLRAHMPASHLIGLKTDVPSMTGSQACCPRMSHRRFGRTRNILGHTSLVLLHHKFLSSTPSNRRTTQSVCHSQLHPLNDRRSSPTVELHPISTSHRSSYKHRLYSLQRRRNQESQCLVNQCVGTPPSE